MTAREYAEIRLLSLRVTEKLFLDGDEITVDGMTFVFVGGVPKPDGESCPSC